MIHEDKNGSKYYENLDESKEEGYIPVRCYSILQFYTLRGRSVKMTKENVETIKYLYYTVFDPNVRLHYIKFFKARPLDVLFWYRKTDTFGGDDEAVESLRKYVKDGNVTLLYTRQQVSDTTSVLMRLYKSHFGKESKLDFRLYLRILEEELRYEDYKKDSKSLTGFHTVCNGFDVRIAELWKQAENK